MSDLTVKLEGEVLKLYFMQRFNYTEAVAIHIMEHRNKCSADCEVLRRLKEV
jgi:hypothetical protein